MNTISIDGRLTRDAAYRTTTTGKGVTSFSVAVNHKITVNGQEKELAEFVNVVVWGYQAEPAGNLKKGARVFVEGRLQSRTYEDKTGQKRYITEVNANLVAIPLQGANAGQAPAPMYGAQQSRGNFERFGAPVQDDIPF